MSFLSGKKSKARNQSIIKPPLLFFHISSFRLLTGRIEWIYLLSMTQSRTNLYLLTNPVASPPYRIPPPPLPPLFSLSLSLCLLICIGFLFPSTNKYCNKNNKNNIDNILLFVLLLSVCIITVFFLHSFLPTFHFLIYIKTRPLPRFFPLFFPSLLLSLSSSSSCFLFSSSRLYIYFLPFHFFYFFHSHI